MPFALILIGLVLIISSARGTLRDLGELLKGDFTGPNNFFIWLVAIGLVGFVGYYSKAQAFSRAFMGLILISMILSNGGFFRQLVDALKGLEGGTASGSGPVGNTLDGQGSRALAPAGNGPQGGVSAPSGSSGNSLEQNVANGLNGILRAGGTRSGLTSAGNLLGSVLQSPVKTIGGILKGLF